MNLENFNIAIKEINNKTYAYGNEILYSMAADPCDLNNKKKLNGAMWIIGRSYAASPQRRAYRRRKKGEKTEGKTYINANGKEVTRPVWPVRTSNDGREGFFEYIAEYIAKHLDKTCISDLISNVKLQKQTYKFSSFAKSEENNNKTVHAIAKEDFELLQISVSAVLSFNAELSKAIEEFDQVPDSNEFDGQKFHCNNHISFASKFLHFYFPNMVFIIDSFACSGGQLLFSKGKPSKKNSKQSKENSKPSKENYICYSKNPKEIDWSQEPEEIKKSFDWFEDEIYEAFSKDDVKYNADKLKDAIFPKIMGDDEPDEPEERNAKTSADPKEDADDKISVKQYIDHCVRSYLLGKYIHDKKITPSQQIANMPSSQQIANMPSFNPMSRLTDAVFLNIKKEPTENEYKHMKSLKETFYNPR